MMNLRWDNNKITFIIDTLHSIGFESKGASIACHKLAYELANQGHYVYVFNEPFFPHSNIKVIPVEKKNEDDGWWYKFYWTPFTFNPNRTVSIYTQITWGNPINTVNNTRWILHDYEEDIWETFNDNDQIFNFGTFETPEGTKQSLLTVFDYKFEEFYNTNNPNRKGFAHIIHKNTPEWGRDFLKQFGSVEIPHYNGQKSLDYLLNEFNKYEYLLTFDDKSYYTSAAGLCGTKSIILNPNKEITPVEYRIKNPIQMCGVAYGFDDIRWADSTIGLVKENLLQLEQKDKQTILNFINHWKNKLL
jgi:hypothetical protein